MTGIQSLDWLKGKSCGVKEHLETNYNQFHGSQANDPERSRRIRTKEAWEKVYPLGTTGKSPWNRVCCKNHLEILCFFLPKESCLIGGRYINQCSSGGCSPIHQRNAKRSSKLRDYVCSCVPTTEPECYLWLVKKNFLHIVRSSSAIVSYPTRNVANRCHE